MCEVSNLPSLDLLHNFFVFLPDLRGIEEKCDAISTSTDKATQKLYLWNIMYVESAVNGVDLLK